MPGFNPDKINIHDLTVEEPEKELKRFFDPEKDITEEDWEEINVDLKHRAGYITGVPIWGKEFCEAIAQTAILGKKYNSDSRQKSGVEKSFKDYQTIDMRDGGEEKLNFAANMVIAGEGDKITPEIKERYKKFAGSKPDYHESRDVFGFESYLSSLAAANIIGDMQTEKIKPDYLNDIHEEREQFYENCIYCENSPEPEARRDIDKWWLRFAKHLSNEKILGITEEPTKDQRRDLLNKLQEYKSAKHWFNYLELASSLTIISADEVRIPEGGGLELIHHKKEKLETENSQVPEQRNF